MVAWDHVTGRGEVRHLFANGDELRTCFQCGYPGYTGGLVIGGYNSSGLSFVPRAPVRGFRSINVFCAIDESIWDLDERREYTYGWSQNYGRGDDGARLEYQGGEVLESGPERVVLRSENTGGCYRVTKVASTRRDARWWIVATRVENRCEHPVRFDFFTGDDPWLGTYRSSDGDIGWTPLVTLTREAAIIPFTSGGIYDLGNEALGQEAAPFSNQANFFEIDPGTALPDHAFLANRFAHAHEEIDPAHVLTNDQMIALNLGWTRNELAPGASLTVAHALGLAITGAPGQTPQAPEIADEDWAVWRAHLGPAESPALEFAGEEVALDVAEGRLGVEATYCVRNPGEAAVQATVRYPVFADQEQLPPSVVRIDGHELPVGAARFVEFPLAVDARAIKRFRVSYEQQLHAPRATYLVTTARAWPTPITRALFTVRRPSAVPVRLTDPATDSRVDRGERVETVLLRAFAPDREVTLES